MATAVEGTTTSRVAAPDAAATPGAAPTRGWRYDGGGKRDLRLDLLRGCAVFAMVTDHLGGPSWLYALTGGNRFFVSAAEGFVFISGVVAGIVYGARARTAGFRATVPPLLQRAWLLYVLAVWLAIGLAVVATVFGLPMALPFMAAPARFIFEVVTLRRTFYLVDVMLLYAFLLLLAPPAFGLLRRRRWWLVALASWGLWAAYQVAPHALQLPWPIADNPVFNLAPWQVLFFTGLILGYGRDWLAARVAARWRHLPAPLQDGWLLLLVALLGVLIWVHLTDGRPLDRYAPGGDMAAALDRWFDKSALPPARLAVAALVFACAWTLVTRLWRPVRAVLGPVLLPLGQGALYAYAAHLFLALVVHAGVVQVWGAGPDGGYPPLHPGVNALLQVAGLLLLWALTRARFLQPVLAPLGEPALLRRPSPPGGRPRWRPSDAFWAVLLVAVVSGGFVGLDHRGAQTASGAPPVVPAAGARPISTVTAPRRVGGAALSASGAPGRYEPPAATPRIGGAALGSGGMPTPTPSQAAAQIAGGYLKDGQFFSKALGRTMPYGIYLPPGYDGDTRRYPLLYMLHGAGGHYSEWVVYGLPEAAEQLIRAGRIPPLIIVFPQGEQSYWANHAGADGERWGDYVAFDLVEHIDSTYRTIPRAGSRAIGGLSMGGFGALHLALKHPNVFGAAGAHSPSLRTPDEAPGFLGDAHHYATIDPLALAATIGRADAPWIWLDIGEWDAWAQRTIALHDLLRTRGIPHEYHSTPGGHDADYWTTHVADYLRFYTTALSSR